MFYDLDYTKGTWREMFPRKELLDKVRIIDLKTQGNYWMCQ